MKPEQERVKALLTDTVTLLCKNGLNYNKELKVQGLLGITTDEDEVFVVHINEKFGDAFGSVALSLRKDTDTLEQLQLSTEAFSEAATKDRCPDTLSDVVCKKEPGQSRGTKRPLDRSSSPKSTSTVSSPSQKTSHSSTYQNSREDNIRGSTVNKTSETIPPESHNTQPTLKIKVERDDLIVLDDDDIGGDGDIYGDYSARPDTSNAQSPYGIVEEYQRVQGQYESGPSPAKRRTSQNVSIETNAQHRDNSITFVPFITEMSHDYHGTSASIHDGQVSGWDGTGVDSGLVSSPIDSVQYSSASAQRSIPQFDPTDSMKARYPSTHLSNPAIRSAIEEKLIKPLQPDKYHVTSFRLIWRLQDQFLDAAWTEVVRLREKCDAVVKSRPDVSFFFSSITAVRSHGAKKGKFFHSVYPGLSYWIVGDPSNAHLDMQLGNCVRELCPSAELKLISPRQSGIAGSLFAVLKDHLSTFIKAKIGESLTQTGGLCGETKNAIKLIIVKEDQFPFLNSVWGVLRDIGFEADIELPDAMTLQSEDTHQRAPTLS